MAQEKFKPKVSLYPTQSACVKIRSDAIEFVPDRINGIFKEYKVAVDKKVQKLWDEIKDGDEMVICCLSLMEPIEITDINPETFTSPDIVCKTCGMRGSQGCQGYCMNCNNRKHCSECWSLFVNPGDKYCRKCSLILEPETYFPCALCRAPRIKPSVCFMCCVFLDRFYSDEELCEKWKRHAIPLTSTTKKGEFLLDHDQSYESPGFYFGDRTWKKLSFLPVMGENGICSDIVFT